LRYIIVINMFSIHVREECCTGSNANTVCNIAHMVGMCISTLRMMPFSVQNVETHNCKRGCDTLVILCFHVLSLRWHHLWCRNVHPDCVCCVVDGVCIVPGVVFFLNRNTNFSTFSVYQLCNSQLSIYCFQCY